MNKKILFSWLLVIIWACVIFSMSSMNTNESNGKSQTIVNEIVEKYVETTNNLGITNKHPSESRKEQFTNKLNVPFRKFAHANEYFILSILLTNALKNSGVNGKKIYLLSILICFLYACTDEFHQLFVDGRTGKFSDVLIDTSGSIIASIFIHSVKKISVYFNKK